MMDSYMILKQIEQRLKDLSTSEYEKMQDAIDNSKIFDELLVQLKILIEKCLRKGNNDFETESRNTSEKVDNAVKLTDDEEIRRRCLELVNFRNSRQKQWRIILF